MEPELIDAIGDYLLAHVERHGHRRTAEVFGVSRHTLWRFLERGRPGRALPHAVTDKGGGTPGELATATRALVGEAHPAPSQRPLRRSWRAACGERCGRSARRPSRRWTSSPA